MGTWLVVAILMQAGGQAPDVEESTPTAEADDASAPTRSEATTKERLEALEEENRRLREAVETLSEDVRFSQERVERLLPLSSRLTGYLDVGAFLVTGDGSGIRTDLRHTYFPEYQNVPDSWVFMGDPLSTAINSRGDPATSGESRAVTFDPIRGSVPGFIVNNVNVSLFAGIADVATVNVSLDLLPRARDVSDPGGFALGDFLDVKLAWAEYRFLGPGGSYTLYAGKVDSALGVEYRTQDAPTRLTITPSLLCRYTCGRPVGLKARGVFLEESLAVMLAVTNGASFVEHFGFPADTDTNAMKTGSGRVSWTFPVGSGLEVGASAAIGAQDGQLENDILQWHYGFDVRGELRDWIFAAEFVRGVAEGRSEPSAAACGIAPCLSYRGAYAQLGYRLSNVLTPYVRADWRRAHHLSGASFVYVSDLARVTAGVRWEPHELIQVKAEAVLNQELGRIPSFPNDTFVSSLVVKY